MPDIHRGSPKAFVKKVLSSFDLLARCPFRMIFKYLTRNLLTTLYKTCNSLLPGHSVNHSVIHSVSELERGQ